ncbi:hypothetical protein AAEX37_01029 [Oligella sp. MSHR50489EDL]|uniref:terminase large subunit domain-containing protein n=1 Tax=Oligella sp. MSHR50489EDL TaxID=3139409 RepID=UPI003D81893D
MNTLIHLDPRREAMFLYWQGWSLRYISEYLKINESTLSSWKRRDKWDESSPSDRIEGAAEYRIIQLIRKEGKSNVDFKELDAMGRFFERMAKVKKYEDGNGNLAHLNPNLSKRRAGKTFKNHIPDDKVQLLISAFKDSLLGYQKIWYDNRHHRVRQILKSRQIGATWYFSREAFIDALITGKNKIFMSASRAQSEIFKNYILSFVREVAEIELKGNPIVLENGATIHFLSTNFATAQGYHGDLYVDEYFWIPRFETVNRTASGMTSQKTWSRTYFSTPSTMSHQAYPFWTGELNAKRHGFDLDLSHSNLKPGKLLDDKHWRQIVNIYDAEEGGADFFDIPFLRDFEYTEEQFQNLFMCEFIDDSKSVFSFEDLQRCLVDSMEQWDDFVFYAARPFGNNEVWIGYDPAVSDDAAGLAVIAPPKVENGKFRLIEKIRLHSKSFAFQAQTIKEMVKKYNVTKMSIDTNGIGEAVYQIVENFYPRAQKLNYNIQQKILIVEKTKDVLRNGRLEMDAKDLDVVQAFLGIKKDITPSGRHITYSAGRTEKLGHADLAWAVMYALANEPIEKGYAEKNGFIYGL